MPRQTRRNLPPGTPRAHNAQFPPRHAPPPPSTCTLSAPDPLCADPAPLSPLHQNPVGYGASGQTPITCNTNPHPSRRVACCVRGWTYSTRTIEKGEGGGDAMRSPQEGLRTVPVSLLCVGSTQRRATALAIGQVPSRRTTPAGGGGTLSNGGCWTFGMSTYRVSSPTGALDILQPDLPFPRGLHRHNVPRERNQCRGIRIGKAGRSGHLVVRPQWAHCLRRETRKGQR